MGQVITWRRVGATVAITAASLLPAGSAGAAFPGVNGKIAFESTRDGSRDIFAMNPDGSAQTRLTDNPGLDAWPDWSPDSTLIAFDSVRDEGAGRRIFTMRHDGSEQTPLTLAPTNDSQAAWSPDGTRIAFTRQVGAQFDIFVMNADGTGAVNLSNHTAQESAPDWSPDGTKIAFTSDRDGTADIFVMNADGSSATNLTNATGFDSLPEWSPDGARIAFHGTRDGGFDVFVMNANGSDQVNLTGASDGASPAWSPDGMRIAFESARDGDSDIYTMKPDGTDVVGLTNNSFFDAVPDWGSLVDSDGDGLPDEEDPDTVAAEVAALPDSAFHARGHRRAIQSRLDEAEAAILGGDSESARRTLENLRRHLDGCESGPPADRDDWIVDCAAQDEVRASLDRLLATL